MPYRNPEDQKQNAKRWRKLNRERYNSDCREWARINRLGSGNKKFKVKKRPFEGHCELCGKVFMWRPHWHHWDDEHPEWGMWLDPRCHIAVGKIESIPNITEKYLELKEKCVLLVSV